MTINQLSHEKRAALAGRLRSSRKVNSSLVDIEWHAAGMATGRQPGTEYKATVKLKEGHLTFLVYLPSPKNSRQVALAVLCRELEGLTLGVHGATVTAS